MKNLRTADLLPKLRERYPKETDAALLAIIRQGMKEITWALVKDGEVDLHSPYHHVDLTFYKYARDPGRYR